MAPLEKYNALPPRHRRRRLLVMLLPLLVGKLFHETKSFDLATKKKKLCAVEQGIQFSPIEYRRDGWF